MKESIMSLWFKEEYPDIFGLAHQIKVKSLLHSERSEFQKIDVYQTTNLGRMLVIDEIVMCTEFDEMAYHEMIVHVPLFAHKNPKRVLIIGGGDGGSVREAVKHPTVEQVDMCEIDERVVRVSEEYLPTFSSEYKNPKVSLHFKDGIQWVKDHKNTYDTIIVDSTDPIGPGAILFTKEFIGHCFHSLKEDGILVNQAQNFFTDQPVIRALLDHGRELFRVNQYYTTFVPTYPGGQIGFTFFSKKYTPFENLDSRTSIDLKSFQFRYWSPELHQASFQLPQFVKQGLGF